MKQQKIFFDFLRFCIGSAKEIPGSLKEADWKELYAIAKKQCLVGVLFDGIQRLPKELVDALHSVKYLGKVVPMGKEISVRVLKH